MSAWNKSSPENPSFSVALQEAKHIVIVQIFKTVQRTPKNKSLERGGRERKILLVGVEKKVREVLG